jgi:hypothetical protein
MNNPRRTISSFYDEARHVLRVYRKPDGTAPTYDDLGLTPDVIRSLYASGADPINVVHERAERMGLRQRGEDGFSRNPTSPGQFPYISQYVYNPRRNRALTLLDFADVLQAAVGLTPKERSLVLMDVGGRMTRLLPKAEAKFREKGLWPPQGEVEAAAPVVTSELPPADRKPTMLRELLGELDTALSAGGDEAMIAEFRSQIASPANREAYLSVLDL